MTQWLRRFLAGRYGTDSLNTALTVLAVALAVLSLATGLSLLYYLAFLLLAGNFFRALSRDVRRRSAENQAFLRLSSRPLGMWRSAVSRFRQRKTHRFYHCPQCRKPLRVPRRKGRISITCPYCRTVFEKTT